MHEIALRVGADRVEEILDWLLLVAPLGVHELGRGDETELRIRGPQGDLPTREQVVNTAGETLIGVEEREVPDDWHARRLHDYEPLRISDRLVIRPAWAPAPAAADVDLILAESAFGTGEHVTTRACIEAMLELEPGGPFADLGCGSGVLAVLAAKLGWSPVVALDNDEKAVAATLTNAEVNGVELDARTADLMTEPPPTAPTVVANIPAPVHLEIAARLDEPPRILVAAALRIDNVDPVVAAYAARGMVERKRRVEGTWVILTLAPR
jgi:ribosomal protein L11 methyltransferase